VDSAIDETSVGAGSRGTVTGHGRQVQFAEMAAVIPIRSHPFCPSSGKLMDVAVALGAGRGGLSERRSS